MMALANMFITDEDALVCDMAEVYGVFDIFELPPQLAATLAVGLRDSSRIKTKMLGMDMPLDDYLMAAIFDNLNWLCWTHTKDAQHGGNAPVRILDILTQKKEQKETEYVTFGSIEEFEAEREKILRG